MIFQQSIIRSYFLIRHSKIPLVNMGMEELSLKQFYKFVPKSDFATDLCDGKFRLGTLEEYRSIENEKQGDRFEATHIYNSGLISGDGNNKDLQTIAQRSRIGIGAASNITIENNTCIEQIPNAFVFCFTEKFNPEALSVDFGGYCVGLSHIDLLYLYITSHLNKRYQVVSSTVGRIVYADRDYTGLERKPGALGFVKPKVPFEEQAEIRFIWLVRYEGALSPIFLEIPEVRNLLSRII